MTILALQVMITYQRDLRPPDQLISYLAIPVRPHLLWFWFYRLLVRVESQNRIVDCQLGHEAAACLDVVWPVLAWILCPGGNWTKDMLFQMTKSNVNVLTAKQYGGDINFQPRKDDLW